MCKVVVWAELGIHPVKTGRYAGKLKRQCRKQNMGDNGTAKNRKKSRVEPGKRQNEWTGAAVEQIRTGLKSPEKDTLDK